MGSLLDLLEGLQRLPEILPLVEEGVLDEVVSLAKMGASVQLRQSISDKFLAIQHFYYFFLNSSDGVCAIDDF